MVNSFAEPGVGSIIDQVALPFGERPYVLSSAKDGTEILCRTSPFGEESSTVSPFLLSAKLVCNSVSVEFLLKQKQ